MNKNRAKKWLLGTLLLVLVYIWWDALGNLGDDSENAYAIRTTASQAAGRDVGRAVVPGKAPEYKPARVNPFYIGSRVNESQKSKTDSPSKRMPPMVSDNYQLLGVLDMPSHPQAVLRGNDGKTHHLEPGDSLGSWELQTLLKIRCIFRHDEYRDTVWLYNPETATD